MTAVESLRTIETVQLGTIVYLPSSNFQVAVLVHALTDIPFQHFCHVNSNWRAKYAPNALKKKLNGLSLANRDVLSGEYFWVSMDEAKALYYGALYKAMNQGSYQHATD